jgi:hypothetical protein
VVATSFNGTREARVAATTLAEAAQSRVCVTAQTNRPEGMTRVPATSAAQEFADHIRRLPEAAASTVDVIVFLSHQPTDLVPLLPPGAFVFIGGRSGRWWPSASQRTAHAFTRLGCRVVFVHAALAAMVA